VDEFTAQGYETHPQLEYLAGNFNLEKIEEWENLRLYLYERR
jgi:hypothetical protein